MEVGFIGLGVMGRPMAGRLQRAGHRLHLWARRPESLAPFGGSGAVVHDSLAALAAATDVAFSIVTASADVERLVLGDDGLIHGARPGWVHVDMSTIAPASARRVAAALHGRRAAMLDAPVSGGAQGAQDATLAIMVGAARRSSSACVVLACLAGRSSYRANGGAVAKACNQMIRSRRSKRAPRRCISRRHGVDLAACAPR